MNPVLILVFGVGVAAMLGTGLLLLDARHEVERLRKRHGQMSDSERVDRQLQRVREAREAFSEAANRKK